MELLKNMGDVKADKAAKLNIIKEDEEDEEDKGEIYSSEDLQIIINQKENIKSKCYKLPQQKIIIK
jgi:hypothetical protein